VEGDTAAGMGVETGREYVIVEAETATGAAGAVFVETTGLSSARTLPHTNRPPTNT